MKIYEHCKKIKCEHLENPHNNITKNFYYCKCSTSQNFTIGWIDETAYNKFDHFWNERGWIVKSTNCPLKDKFEVLNELENL